MTTEGREIGIIEAAIESAENFRDTVTRPFVSAMEALRKFATRGPRGRRISEGLIGTGAIVATLGVVMGIIDLKDNTPQYTLEASDVTHENIIRVNPNYDGIMKDLSLVAAGTLLVAVGAAALSANEPDYHY